ncbi:hypothetical protein EJ04DRAFT_599123 [Polyplosphaeria fusca]|uniref:Uncharacterized protein n=1 Tax=Polyplosphaeria fusca TaxID=682080 RepID=A0A9P4UVA6_9PLEO|nr:hypothetical protein EJ04DRAFT_599123 [Polyplosphaeria fusca]
MQLLVWGAFCFQLVLPLVVGTPVISSSTVTSAHSPDLVERAGAGPSAYPYDKSSPNDFSWENWDPQDTETQQADGRKIFRSWIDMQEMVYYAWQEADAKSDTLKRWFDEADADSVKKVLERVIDPKVVVNNLGAVTPLMKDWVLDRNDFASGCTRLKNAYSASNRGYFRLCPKGISQPEAEDMECKDLDQHASQKMKSVAFSMMHVFEGSHSVTQSRNIVT